MRKLSLASVLLGAICLAAQNSPSAGSARQNISAHEAAAVAYLRTINTAAVTFAATYRKGFVDDLKRMTAALQGQSPDENRADLIAPWLAGSNHVTIRNGYQITYIPGRGAFGNLG